MEEQAETAGKQPFTRAELVTALAAAPPARITQLRPELRPLTGLKRERVGASTMESGALIYIHAS